MKQFLRFLLLPLLIIAFCQNASASHAMGADLQYTCLGGNQYLIRLSFYRDCTGIPASSFYPVEILGCGATVANVNLNQVTNIKCAGGGTSGTDGCVVSPICTDYLAQSTCSPGGTAYPGVRQLVYEGIVTLNSPCASWQVRFTESARNPSQNTQGGGSENLSVIAVINNTIDPNSGYNGVDSIVYRICDNGAPQMCDTAVAYLNVGNTKNYAPVVAKTSLMAVPGVPGTFCAFIADANPGNVVNFNQLTCFPTQGSVSGTPTVSFANGTGTICFNYTPISTATGKDSFCFSVCDNAGACKTSKIIINIISSVNVNPNAVTDTFLLTGGDSLIGYSPLMNDYDGNQSDVLVLSTTPVTNPSSGQVTINSLGQIRYVPAPGFFGVDSFRYRVCDNNPVPLCDTATVCLGVFPPGVYPPFAPIRNIAIINDSAIAICTPVTDANRGDSIVLGNVLHTPAGTSVGGFAVDNISRPARVCYTINAGNFTGNDSVTFIVCDKAGLCDTVRNYFTVTAKPNRSPIAKEDVYQVPVSGAYNGSTVTGNDVDPNTGQTFTTTVIKAPANGTFSMNANGTFTFTPTPPTQICNNSTQFTSLPTPFYCINSGIFYNQGAVDADGDSLVYALINPLGSGYANIGYNTGYSVTAPIKTQGGFSFNPATGQMTFKPNAIEADVLTVKVSEYRNGTLVGSTMRDIQVQIIQCTVSIPEGDTANFSTVNNATKEDSITISVCPGTTATLELPFYDKGGKILTLTSSLQNDPSPLPGAVFTANALGTGDADSMMAVIKWTPSDTITGCRQFIITAENNDCPINGRFSKAYRVCIVDQIKIIPSGTVYCGGTPITLKASGGTVFDWSPSAGLSDTTIKAPLATPSASTWYKLTSDCGIDSVRINVAPPFAFDAGLGGTICKNGQIELNASVASTFAPYVVKWTPASGLVDPVSGKPASNILNPVASPPITTKYMVSFTGSTGCINTDSVTVNVNGLAPRIEASTNKNLVCPGQPVTLSIISNPEACGIATSVCTGITKLATVGSGTAFSTNTLAQYPSPFGDYNKSSRQQYLYKASNIIPVTGSGGTITTIAFETNGAGGPIKDFTVKLGCTSADSLTGFQGGLSTVFNAATYTSTAGWNTITLASPYEWDGTSNLVVDICNNNTSLNKGNLKVRSTTMPYRAVYVSASTSNNQCGITGTPLVGNALKPFDLPNLRMNICVTDFSKLNVAWTPSSGPNAPAPLNKDTVYATPQSPQIYNVAVSDVTGCEGKDFVYVNVDTTAILTFNNDTFICANNPSIVLKAAVKSSLPANSFTYTWAANPASGFSNPGNVSQFTVSPAIATKYYVTVTGGSCPMVDSMTFSVGSNIPVTFNDRDVTCFGRNDGYVKVKTSGGITPLSYTWLPASYSGDSISNLGPGVYNVTVTDAKGCTGTASDTITEPAVLQLNFSLLNINCNRAANGNITATVVGGTPTYTYTWSPNVSGSNSASSLDTGAYSLTVTDSRGCTITGSRTLTEPAGMTITVTTTDATTNNGTDGTANSNVAGGTAPFTYVWSNGGTTQNIANLDSGTYCVTVTDSKGCTKTACGFVDNPPPILLVFTNVNVTCPGSSDGSSSVVASGGINPYRYKWSTGNVADTLSSVSNLKAGVYTVTVTDSSGVQVIRAVPITEPPVIVLGIDTFSVTCTGRSDGAVLALATGGTAPFAYAWQAPLNAATARVDNLPAGTYTVIATDQKGCADTASATLADPLPIVATMGTITNVNCYGGKDGTATVNVTGGTPAYAYIWSNSTQATATVNDLAAGTGFVTVTDSKGCADTTTYTLTEPAPFTVVVNPVDASCATSNDGSATTVVTGGVAPYKYQWDGVQGADNISTLDTGFHTVIVTDQNSCTATATFTTDTVYVLRVGITTTDATCFGSTNGTVTVAPVNGTPAYTFNYLSSLNTVVIDPTALQAGNYTVTATDSKSCNAEGAFTINQPTEIVLSFGIKDPLCFNDNNGKAWVTPSGGTLGYTYDWSPNASVTDTLGGVPAGTYQVVVTDGIGCTSFGDTVLVNPTQLTSSIINKTEITCANNIDGKAEIEAVGGTPPYSYLWSDLNNTSAAQLTGAGPTTYTATVTDINGCSSTSTVTFTSPPLITFSIAQGDSVSCPGYTDGTIELLGFGGTPGFPVEYTYAINNGIFQNSGDFKDLAAGTYSVTIRDGNNCEADTILTVGQPIPLVVSVLPNDTTLELGEQIQLYSFIQGYTTDAVQAYIWVPGTGLSCTDCASPVVSTFNDQEYTLTVRYRNKCSASAQVNILVKDGPEFFIPNMFSPNGDGQNDKWELYGLGLREVSATIFNRWGEKVFDSMGNQFTSWDGTFKGVLLDTDVYVYYVKVVYLNGKVKEKTGSITLVN